MTLADRQAAVVAALVAGAPAPPGFDTHRVRATAAALLRKRTGEVAAAWPLLAAALGADWSASFGAWAAGRPPAGALRDGWDFARFLDRLPALAAGELAAREVTWHYDGVGPPRRRRGPAWRRAGGAVYLQLAGHLWRTPAPFSHRAPNPRDLGGKLLS
jgi:hypothetical protein